jgi:hypothetical protein
MPDPVRDVVVIVPGILGSVLEKGGKEIWGLSAEAGVRGLLTAGKSVKALELDGDSPTDEFLDDDVRATALIDDLHLIPGLWKIDGYGRIAAVLRQQLDLQDGVNLFTFPYDWRRDIRSSAIRLQKASAGWLEERRKTEPDAKLVLLCHSMGSLVARWFLHKLGGWRDTRLVVTFGAPYRGSINPIDFMSNGFRKKFLGITLLDLTPMARSLTGLYQMSATYECIDTGDGTLRRLGEVAGVPGIDPARAKDALAFMDAMREAAKANVATDEYKEHGPLLLPVVGVFQPTRLSARVSGDRLEILNTLDGKDPAGDGTVPRASATPHELQGQGREVYMGEAHSKLQNWEPTLVQIRGAITTDEVDWDAFQLPEVRHGLEVDDLYAAAEPIEFRVRTQDPALELSVTVTARSSGAPLRITAPAGEEWRKIKLDGLAPDVYDITVADSVGAGKPVSDIVVVSAPAVTV